MFSISEIIALAVRIEKNAEATYRKAIEQSQNVEVKELLAWMANEEKEHGAWFSSLEERIGTLQEKQMEDSMEMDGDFISNLIGKQAFSLGGTDFSTIQDTEQLKEIFVELENDTILFYEMMKTFISHGPTLEHLQTIINEEKDHIEQLEKTPWIFLPERST
ncbi:MAG: ferritin family protein [Desulfobacterium sp.]|nr:ferritin family protein [Desulfobacterium sp.]